MVKRQPSQESGFSLIETMMAMLLLAVSFLALGQLVAVAANQNALSRNTSVEIAVAMGKLEQLRRIYNNHLADITAPAVVTGSGSEMMKFDPALGLTETDTNIGSYKVTWTVTPVAGTANEYTVKVQVEPTNLNRSQSKTVEIFSHFAP
jgi:prepilin-type N-terminal cleavage/methylation domain-containing protein